MVSCPQVHLILHNAPGCRHFTDKETSSERLSNLPDITQHRGGRAGLPNQVPVKKSLRPGLLFVKEEMDTRSWEASASGHATGSWQNGQEQRPFSWHWTPDRKGSAQKTPFFPASCSPLRGHLQGDPFWTVLAEGPYHPSPPAWLSCASLDFYVSVMCHQLACELHELREGLSCLE